MSSTFFRRKQPEEIQPRKAPWTEKYRPRTLSDVAAQEQIVGVLKQTLESANLPHMLFYGPPGTGKTSTILALAKDLFGPELARTRVLELNASDERGISVVRDKIKNFARTIVSAPPAETREKFPCPDFKLVILDEADQMTQDAQAALRRTMENYSKMTRFCLICNYVTRIIDPLASRCSKLRFHELDKTNSIDRLKYIAGAENVAVKDEVLIHLLNISRGDLRRAITLLQSACGLADPEVTMELIDELSGTVPVTSIDTLMQSMQRGVQKRIGSVVQSCILEGWNVARLIEQLHDRLICDPAVNSSAKSRIALCLSEADRRLCDGSDEQLELLNVATQISQALCA